MLSEVAIGMIPPAVLGIIAAIHEDGIPDRAPHLLAIVLAVGLNCLATYYSGPNPNYAEAILLGIPLGMAGASLKPAVQQTVSSVKATGARVKTGNANRPRVTFARPVNVVDPIDTPVVEPQ